MGNRVLILPLVLLSDDLVNGRSYLSRQLPVMVRNALDALAPGAFIAAPLAAETDGVRRWVVHREPWKPETAVKFGRNQDYGVVVTGALSSVDGRPDLRAEVQMVDCADAHVIASSQIEGSTIEIVEGILALCSELIGVEPLEASALFRPGTTSSIAHEFYAEGLDALLTLRSQGMELRDRASAVKPFELALTADSEFEAAVTAGLSTALQCLESDRIDSAAALLILDGWRVQRPDDKRIAAVMVELLIAEDRLEEALRLLCEVNAADPDRDLVRRTADLLVEMGRFSEALPLYQKVEQMRHDAVVLERISALAQMEGQFDLALSAVRQLTQEVDDRPSLWCRLAWLRDKIGVEGDVWSAFRRGFSQETAPDLEDLLKLNSVLAHRDVPEWFVGFLQHWMPQAGFSLDARVLLGRALRLSGSHMAAHLCLQSIDESQLNGEFQAVLAGEQSALSQR